jgi:Tol biopolymer transport system component
MVKQIIVVALLVAATSCRSMQPQAVIEGGEPELVSGSVVFAGMDGNLHVAHGRGEVLQITRSARTADRAVSGAYGWSGDRVVYGVQERSSDGGVTGTVYSVVPGGQSRRLVRRRNFAPFFIFPSPDDTRVAYLGSIVGEASLLMGSIAFTGRDEIVHGTGAPFYAAWSPDGKTLMTHVGTAAGPARSAMQFQSVEHLLAGDAPDRVLDLRAGNFQSPAYSADGRSIAVALAERGVSTVSVLSPSGDRVMDLAPLEGIAALAWSPVGNNLAFVDGSQLPTGGIFGPLWIVDPDRRNLRRVADRVSTFFWSPDGTKILYFEPFFAGSGATGALIYRVGLFRVSEDTPESVGVLRPSEAFVRQIVPFFDQYLQACTIWSPDSRLVVINSARTDGTSVIHLVDTERRRSGSQFSVSLALPVQDSADAGLVTEEGFTSRILGYGTNPFFSREDAALRVPDRPETDS